uniref:Group II intron reverse transcriptase/maturase n=1 Tax=Ulva ohnoi TaxID=240864 RepID=A0A2Z6FB90_9CHLO|nr:group II intron reverse transcriptase/maturase [Ulva ohnoi]
MYKLKVKDTIRITPKSVSQSVVLPERTTKHLTHLILRPRGKAGFHIWIAERLRGPQHVKEGWLGQRCLGKKAVQAKSVKANLRNVSGVHIPPQVDITEPVLCYRRAKSSVRIEPDGRGLLRRAGPRISPKALVKPNHWNSGLAKGRKTYANGDLIVVRPLSNKVGQPKTLDQPSVDHKTFTDGEAKTVSAKVAEMEVGSYKTLFQPKIYKIAYEIIKSKKGNTTPGVDKATLDGIGLPWINKTIGSMKDRSFKFQPAVRKYIPKPNGKLRPLGIPTPKDKVVQQAIRMIIEPLFEPHFLNSSHGFRPKRSAHTALKDIRQWTGITWAIEGDIKGCFDNVNHHTLGQLLKKRVKDENLISLYWKAVNAGYVNNGNLEPHSLSGVPQGGVLSPFLSNVYMHELDVFVEELKVRFRQSSNRRGVKQNPEYTKILKQLRKLRAEGNGKLIRKAELERDSIPSVIRTGTRIYYVRYADDWIIGVRGPKELAQKIKDEVEIFLREKLNLELSKDKTAITHLPTKKAFFLGTIIRRHSRKYLQGLTKKRALRRVRGSNSRIILECPINKIVGKLINQGYAHAADGKPKAVTKWIYMKPEEIILRYNAVIRGYLNYYSFANNRNMLQRIVWILGYSAVFTFARKWNISPKKVFKKLGNPPSYTTRLKTRKGKKEVTYKLDRGDLSINPMKFDLINESGTQVKEYIDPAKIKYFSTRSHFTLDKPCCVCGTDQNVEMHHIRHLRKNTPGRNNRLKRLFLQIKRKQIPVCRACHKTIHDGEYDGRKLGNLG